VAANVRRSHNMTLGRLITWVHRRREHAVKGEHDEGERHEYTA
jgi:hypothetical protein